MTTMPFSVYLASQPAAMEATALTAPLLVPVIVAGSSFVAGALVGKCIEMSLREFEENCRFLSYEARWYTAQGIRAIMVGAGTTLTVTALLGIIGGASLLAVVSLASAGIGLAVVGAVGFVVALDRYTSAKRKDEQAYRNSILSELAGTMDHLSDDSLKELSKKHKFTHDDITTILLLEPDVPQTGTKFLRLRRCFK